MAKLLRYLVDQSLAGTDTDLKADTIAIEALGRGDDFDSSSDSYPRVQIGRLRKLLDRFYAENPGTGRLSIPLNDYRVVMQSMKAVRSDRIGEPTGTDSAGEKDDAASNSVVTEPAEPETVMREADQPEIGAPRKFIGRKAKPKLSQINYESIEALKKRQAIAISLVAILIAFAAAIYAFGPVMKGAMAGTRDFVPMPVLVVDPVKADSKDGSDMAMQSDVYWADSFRRFQTLRLRQTGEVDADQEGSYRLNARILGVDGEYMLSVQLFDVERHIIWSRIYDLNETGDLTDALAKTVAQISPLDGVIAQNFAQQMGDIYTPGYPCLIQQQRYLRYREEQMLPEIRKCLTKSVELAEDPATYMAALSFVTYVEKRLEDDAEVGAKLAAELSLQAVENNPDNDAAVFAAARTAFFAGECRRGKTLAKRALELNPYNVDIISYTGVYLFGCNDEEAEGYLRKSLELRPNQNTGIPIALAFLLVREDRSEEALEVIDNIVTLPGPAEPQYKLVWALANAKRGNVAEAKRIWSELAKQYNLPADTNPEKVLVKFVTSPALVREAVAILEQENVVN